MYLAGMYRGASACFLRDIPFSGIYFSTYAWVKEQLRTGNEPLHSIELFFSASVAGNAFESLTSAGLETLWPVHKIIKSNGECCYL